MTRIKTHESKLAAAQDILHEAEVDLQTVEEGLKALEAQGAKHELTTAAVGHFAAKVEIYAGYVAALQTVLAFEGSAVRDSEIVHAGGVTSFPSGFQAARKV